MNRMRAARLAVHCVGGAEAHEAHLDVNDECPWCGAHPNMTEDEAAAIIAASKEREQAARDVEEQRIAQEAQDTGPARTPYAVGSHHMHRAVRLALAYGDALNANEYERAWKVRRAWWRLTDPSDVGRWQRFAPTVESDDVACEQSEDVAELMRKAGVVQLPDSQPPRWIDTGDGPGWSPDHMVRTCDWYLRCTRPAAGWAAHPILKRVAVCQPCAEKHDLELQPLDEADEPDYGTAWERHDDPEQQP